MTAQEDGGLLHGITNKEEIDLRPPKIRSVKVIPLLANDGGATRSASTSLSALFASTSTLPPSRSSSPSTEAASKAFLNGTSSPRRSASPLPRDISGIFDHARSVLARAFAPHVAVHASDDTEALIHNKGIEGGLLELFRPFGERISGKVTTRDSIGASKSWQDFGIHFTTYKSIAQGSQTFPGPGSENNVEDDWNHIRTGQAGSQNQEDGQKLKDVELLVERHLEHAEEVAQGEVTERSQESTQSAISPFYDLYMRRLVSRIRPSPHESFSHPVACIIAISSKTPHPIETLRQLYDELNRGEHRLPPWISNDFLRYYVLVHDEERDEIAKSTVLFEQMKRHFGLNCHLLRIRSAQSVPTDDDTTRLPVCEWQAADEELDLICRKEKADDGDSLSPCIFESDANAVRTFVREMVTQSIIPYMERSIATWNDQVASRRRGISGRFMSLSRKWTGFSGSSRSTSGGNSTASGDGSNYSTVHGFYKPDAPEATMRRLADFAFMLRDWKLAHGVYELLKSDFSNDKAWKYHAGAYEMSALSLLISSPGSINKTQAESLDAALETAHYSYITRCGSRYEMLRCLTFAVELFQFSGSHGCDHAAQWATRIIDMDLTDYIGTALFTERVAACFATKVLSPRGIVTYRRRKASFWSVLAANAWKDLQLYAQASRCLQFAEVDYGGLPNSSSSYSTFEEALGFMENLRRVLKEATATANTGGHSESGQGANALHVDEEHEDLGPRNRRYSVIDPQRNPPVSFEGGDLKSASSVALNE
ncbi:MAG: hypothetical protein M1814_000701 [Vezdaea aestivalis]|nr:MAG: hypothetical protein M1814_000701 [Vezdaea aestivalis]